MVRRTKFLTAVALLCGAVGSTPAPAQTPATLTIFGAGTELIAALQGKASLNNYRGTLMIVG